MKLYTIIFKLAGKAGIQSFEAQDSNEAIKLLVTKIRMQFGSYIASKLEIIKIRK